MKINSINREPSFQARFANDVATKKVLSAVKKDIMATPTIGNSNAINDLLKGYSKVCRGEAYRLSKESDKLVMTSVIPNKYRNTEPVKDGLGGSFMRLIGKFINFKSI